MEAIFLPYAAQRVCAWPFKALVFASNAIGLSLLVAPLAWYQVGSMLARMFTAKHPRDQIISTLAPHIISLPAEIMMLTSVVGVLMALAAGRQAQVMALEAPVSRAWSAAIAFGVVCNVAGILANGLCLIGA